MPKPAPEPATEIPPPARDAVAALTAAPGDPVKILVSGGIGSGKSSVLAAVRSALRTAGVPVLTRPPRSGDEPDAAVVIDDAHLLDDAELEQLVDRVADPASTVVVATEPLAHRPALRALGHRNRTREPRRVTRRVEPTRRHAVSPPKSSAPHRHPSSSARSWCRRPGCRFCCSRRSPRPPRAKVEAPATAIAQAAKFALIERLRRSGRASTRHPAGDIAEPRPRARRRRGDAAGRGAGRPDPGGPRPRQRIDRTVAQPHVPAFRASLHRSDHRDRATSRHRDRTARLPDRIFNAVSRSRSTNGRARTARRPAGQRARRSCVRQTTANPQGPQGFTVRPRMRERRSSARDWRMRSP